MATSLTRQEQDQDQEQEQEQVPGRVEEVFLPKYWLEGWKRFCYLITGNLLWLELAGNV